MKRIYSITVNRESTDSYFYIGIAHSKSKQYRIIKIGVTDRIEKRAAEHRKHLYSNDGEYGLSDFQYIETIKLKRSTARNVENSVRNYFKFLENEDEIFIRNDRYVITHNDEIEFKIAITPKKVYKIVIPAT